MIARAGRAEMEKHQCADNAIKVVLMAVLNLERTHK